MLEVRGIDVHYGPIQALFGIGLRVGEGEKVALVGSNGAGKTTTLRTVSGMIAPTAGEILFEGERIDGLPAFKVIERGVAHLPEGRELFRDLSVLDNLRLGHWTRGKGRGATFKRKADEVMDHFPILRERAHQAAGTLSGGEQQMLIVARALMSDPRLLVVDELSLGLAPMIVSQLFEILEEINRAGTSLLIVEQFVHMALEHTNRAYALAKGRVALEGQSRKLATSSELREVYLGGAGEVGSTHGNGAARPRRKARR
jgi:branched-chain amino acid transport system ATP-binding protein